MAMSSVGARSVAVLADRGRGIVLGGAVADALAMPTHWYYDPRALKADYGEVREFVKPKFEHAGSIMGLSNTGGAGRGSQEGDVIGAVINHGKRDHWRRGVHYHCTLQAGENTLNTQVTRLLVRTMTETGGYSAKSFLDAYVAFMTTPGSHNDAYAESYHRMFFANYAKGVAPEKCAGDDGHNIASMGGFVMLPPVAMYAAAQAASGADGTIDIEAAAAAAGAAAGAHVLLTHRSAFLSKQANIFGQLIARVALGVPLKDAIRVAGAALGLDIEKLAARASPPFGTACYIEDSFPWLLFLAYKYGDDFEAAMVKNVAVGGENVHRGAALGALLGAAHGADAIPSRWRSGLYEAKQTAAEADAFAALLEASALGAALHAAEDKPAAAAPAATSAAEEL
jgi:ADP-ribosylglycohydrolase